ncbi:laccase domain protein [Bacteroidia bacterium]|nr:laccase domain protein [Bacteroidia bacterium]
MTKPFDEGAQGRLQFPRLQAYDNLSHFVTTCRGAAALSSALGIPRLYVSKQVHGSRIAVVDSRTGELEGFDALVTVEPGICIAVATADCVPLLLYAPDCGAVAAVHAGWRGTVLRIASETVRLMEERFGCNPRLMRAGIAPSIGPEAFEVGEEVLETFLAAGIDMSRLHYRHPATGKAHIDLKKANLFQLLEAGLQEGHIDVSDICTYSQAGEYFSARRQGIDCGRMLTGILIEN